MPIFLTWNAWNNLLREGKEIRMEEAEIPDLDLLKDDMHDLELLELAAIRSENKNA